MNWGIDVPQMAQQQPQGMLQFTGGMMSGQPPPQFPPIEAPQPAPMGPPMGQTVQGPNGPVFQPFIPPGAGQQNRNIESMTLNQLQDLILNGDPNAEELRRATERIQQLRAGILQTMPQPTAPMGVPAPGM